MAKAPAIEADNLTKLFGPKTALSKVSFSVPAGTIFGFLGPNGAGKTTTIRCLMDFIRPTTGSITVFGNNANKYGSKLKNKIGFLAADMQLNEKWTAEEHLQLAEKARSGKSDMSGLIKLLDLDTKAKVKNLSTGNKQKLAIILAFVGQPKLLVMDEPTRGLDPVLQNVMYDLLKDFAAKGNTVFFSSHNLSEVQRICDGVIVIKDGAIVTEQGMNEIRGANIHIINAVTKKPLDKETLISLGAEIRLFHTRSVSLKIKGGISPLISYLVKSELLDLSVSHASLEDVFLEKYKDMP